MNDFSRINPYDVEGGKIVEEVLFRVKSIEFESVGESWVMCGLEESSGIELKSSKTLIDEFSDAEGFFSGFVDVCFIQLVEAGK